jgi:hypothetical protein
MADETPREAVQDALGDFLREGEIITAWVVVAEVADAAGTHLIHRAGGGIEGNDPPMLWSAIGMLRSGEIMAEQQLADLNKDPPG